MNETEALHNLRRASKRRDRADDDRQLAAAELHKFAHIARATGVGVTEIAGAARLSRQAVYEILGQQPSQPR